MIVAVSSRAARAPLSTQPLTAASPTRATAPAPAETGARTVLTTPLRVPTMDAWRSRPAAPRVAGWDLRRPLAAGQERAGCGFSAGAAGRPIRPHTGRRPTKPRAPA